MLVIDGQLCYSPLPPEQYGRDWMGHGQMFGRDLQLWNLMYLSLPGVEDYLVPGADPEVVYNSIPIERTAACIAQLRGEHMLRQYPRMRYWLTLPPYMFCKEIANLSAQLYCALPTAMNIPDWAVITMMRAKHVMDNDPAVRSLDSMLAQIRKEIGA